jgi:hypothetical protein
MTQDRYTRRGKVHPEVAALLDRSINGELTMAEASFRPPTRTRTWDLRITNRGLTAHDGH